MNSWEEWWHNHILQHGINRLNKYHHAKAAYRAGMLRAAEIVDETEEGCGYGCPNIIAAAIMKEAGE